MGSEGWAVTLVTPEDGQYLTGIEKLINQEIEQKRFPGFEPPEVLRRAEAQKPAEPEEPSSGIPNWNRPRRRR
jgi:ATP-dependent RNA helicase RhlE